MLFFHKYLPSIQKDMKVTGKINSESYPFVNYESLSETFPGGDDEQQRVDFPTKARECPGAPDRKTLSETFPCFTQAKSCCFSFAHQPNTLLGRVKKRDKKPLSGVNLLLASLWRCSSPVVMVGVGRVKKVKLKTNFPPKVFFVNKQQ